jgi:hypothetical protein
LSLIKPKSEIRKIREFAAIVSFGFVLIFTALPWMRGHAPRIWPLILAAILLPMSLVLPNALKPLYRAWMRVGDALGWINSRIILSVLFFAVLTPIGFLMRLGDADPLRLRLRTGEGTYRQAARLRSRESMERMF